MINAYNELYLDDAMKNLGEAFDYAVNDYFIDGDKFMEFFVSSNIAKYFENGDPHYISGLSGTELVLEVLDKVGIKSNYPKPTIDYSKSPEYWCGYILAYYQWTTNKSFRDIHNYLSIKELRKLYSTLHEASEEKAVDTLNIIIRNKQNISKLQRQRRTIGLSQRQLANKANVNLRTLQQYELKTKDINKASIDTVMSLARALNCQIESILE